MRAIDLYSGIGGWTIGLRCAGFDVVASYELNPAAVAVAQRNLGGVVLERDITKVNLIDFPKVDVIVGSPPCTDFSFSNRGGGGDITNGLTHVIKFLRIVQHVRPKYWAMENVPRLASILSDEASPYAQLKPFRELLDQADKMVLDASEFGLPQRRQRCIIGKLPFELLSSYSNGRRSTTLGHVIRSLKQPVVTDINYGIKLPGELVTDHHKEPYLDWEEIRINSEAKVHHPVYNRMPFPDKLDRPVRTITATCTRVSRESIVVSEGRKKNEKIRRLTIRERACLQGFPITYQLDGGVGEKMRLVGNAMPPVLSYYIANAMKGTPRKNVVPLSKQDRLPFPALRPNGFRAVEAVGHKYPMDRRFRFAITGLRFGSGMRFDLSNHTTSRSVNWNVQFYFGPSTDIRTIVIDDSLFKRIRVSLLVKPIHDRLKPCLKRIATAFAAYDATTMQDRWVKKYKNGQHPFRVTDAIGAAALGLLKRLHANEGPAIEEFILSITQSKAKKGKPISTRKLSTHSRAIFCGLLVACQFNRIMTGGRLPTAKER